MFYDTKINEPFRIHFYEWVIPVVGLFVFIVIGGFRPPNINTSVISAAATPSPTSTKSPDIVVILTDDQRYDTMQYMPKTQELLGNQGVTFTNAFVSTPLCCPSRASILTGLYAHNHGVYGNEPPRGGAGAFNPAETIAVWLDRIGYQTGIYGKYLNGSIILGAANQPGWDEWHIFSGKNGGYFFYKLAENGTYKKYFKRQQYSTTQLAAMSVQFIENTPPDQPLFLYYTPYAPHRKAQVPAGTFIPSVISRPPNYNEQDVSDKPAWVKTLPLISADTEAREDDFHGHQMATLAYVDDAVEQIVAALERTERLNNSVIIFTSDNGLSWGEHRLINKECPYTECSHVPLIIRAPGIFPRTDDHLVQNIDLAPTIAEFTGVTIPIQVDGQSMVPLLKDPTAPWRTDILIEGLTIVGPIPKYSEVRNNQYAYIEYKTGEKELYDLVKDPWQLNNIVSDPAMADVIGALQQRLNQLKQ